jgi:hypothetical protein
MKWYGICNTSDAGPDLLAQGLLGSGRRSFVQDAARCCRDGKDSEVDEEYLLKEVERLLLGVAK